MTLDLTGKHCPVIFLSCFVFRFREITHENMQVFLAANAHLTDSIVSKNQSFLSKGHRQEKNCVFAHVNCGK